MALMGFVQGQPVDLGVVMDNVPQAELGAQLQVPRAEGAFKQEDGAAPVEPSQALGFVQVEHGDAIGSNERGDQPFDAVAVGAGLGHGPDFCIRRGRPGAGEVVSVGGGVNEGFDGPGHRFIVPAACYNPAAPGSDGLSIAPGRPQDPPSRG